MASRKSIIKNYNWNEMSQNENNWIKLNDIRYQFLRNEIINWVYPNLRIEDKELLLNGLVRIINLIYLKFGFENIYKR